MRRLRVEFEVIVEDADVNWSMGQLRQWLRECVRPDEGERLVKVKREDLGEVPDESGEET